MAGLLILSVVVLWVAFSVWISAYAFASVRYRPARIFVTTFAIVVCFFAPIADDIVGSWQYNGLCTAAKGLKILGTVAVGPDTGLYTSDGKWLIATPRLVSNDEWYRLKSVAERLLFSEVGTSSETQGALSITERTDRVYAATSRQLLIEVKSYHYRGGFLRRNLFDSASQCFAEENGVGLYEKLSLPAIELA